jgi:predicted permease
MTVRLWHMLQSRLRSLLFRSRRESDLAEELQQHIDREAERLEASGLSPEQARRQAVRLFGGVVLIAEACRDERRTAVIDNLVRDIRYAFRSFRRTPLAATTIMATVALGLGLVTVAFTFLNTFLFRVDHVRDVHEMYAVERPHTAAGGRYRFTYAEYEALARETGVFSGTIAMLPDIDSRVDGRMMAGTLVSGNFFDVLGVRATLGRTLTTSDDAERGGEPAVVLSHRGWDQHFARDPGVLGRTLLLSGIHFTVVGVMPEGFRGLVIGAPDYWMPISFLGQVRPAHAGREDSAGVEIVGRLAGGVSREQALAELLVWSARAESVGTEDRSRAGLRLTPRPGTVPQPLEALAVVAPLFIAFGLILLIACANVANLLLARGFARQREIGIRLATGASRGRIISQLLTESLLLALGSAALAFVVSRIVLASLIYAFLTTMPPDLGDIRLAVPPADWRVAVFLLLGALLSTLAFALAPAFQATRLELVRAIRGDVLRDARPGRTRSVLVAVQVTASVLLLICSAVFLRSALSAATVDPGIRTGDTVSIRLTSESLRQAALDVVRRQPSVTAIAASWPEAVGEPRAAFAEGPRGRLAVAYKFVSPEYFEVLGIAIIHGRGFTAHERSSSAPVAVVSEAAARRLWPDKPAIGQVLKLDPDPSPKARRDGEPPLISRTVAVVGVARDVAGFRLAEFTDVGVYVPTSAEAAGTSLTVRVKGDPELARRALLDRLSVVDTSISEVFTLRTLAGMESYFLRIAFWLTLALGGLALALTLSGLFSVLSYLVAQRTREIGVRLALGATRRDICGFVLSQLARPVVVGLVAGGGLAAALGGALLATPAAGYIDAAVHLFDPVAYGASLLSIVAACAAAGLVPAIRAGRIDPVATLRQD